MVTGNRIGVCTGSTNPPGPVSRATRTVAGVNSPGARRLAGVVSGRPPNREVR